MSIYPLIINSNNVVSGNNSQFVYNFPIGSVDFRNSKISLASLSLYYSWFNITSAFGNNSFTISWPGTLTVNHLITLTDGFYSVAELNAAMQDFFVTNN